MVKLKVRYIPSYEGRYAVSKCGKVVSYVSGKPKLLKPCQNHLGYLRVDLKGKQWYVHRLVALTYLGPDNGLEVNHKDLDRSNNHVNNLEYVSHTQNIRHSVEQGSYNMSGITKRAKDDVRILLSLGLSSESEHEILGLSLEAIEDSRIWE